MELLCVAAEADPTGYVLVNGRTPTTTDLARMTGEPEAVVQSALEELERNGVFSRDRHGRIYSRRLVREAKASAINQKNGKLGGNPTLCKTNGNLPLDNPPDKGQVKPHIPEARVREEKNTLTGVPKEPAADPVDADLAKPPAKPSRESRKRQVPSDFRPSENGIDFAFAHAGWMGARLSDEVDHFVDHHRALKNTFTDPELAWKNWVRIGAKKQAGNGYRNGRRSAHADETAAFDAVTRYPTIQ